MITPILEQLIAKGIAKPGTFTFGGSGVATIPVPNDEVLIIHHFDYWYFLDVAPDLQGQPAISHVTIVGADPVNVQWQLLPGAFTAPVLFASGGALPGAVVLFQAQLNLLYPGFTIINATFVAGTLDFDVVSTAPGATFNGQFPNVIALAPLVAVSGFVGGTNGFVSLDAVQKVSEHVLNFRSKNSANHFVIREHYEIFSWQQIGIAPPDNFYVNVNGFYSKDCYLAHLENVQIGIWTVPPVTEWAVIYGALPLVSNEARTPVGYGIGAPGALAVTQIIWQPAINPLEQYLPLTTDRDDTVQLQVHEQFRPDMIKLRALNNPTIPIANFNLQRRTPLVNLDYVLISTKNYSKYFGGSI